jgi:hypothetical protein
MGWSCMTHEREEECVQCLVGRSQERPVGKPRLRWNDDPKMYLMVMWTRFVWRRKVIVAGCCAQVNEPTSSVKWSCVLWGRETTGR